MFKIKRIKLIAGLIVFFIVAITLSYYPTQIQKPITQVERSNLDEENLNSAVFRDTDYYYAGYRSYGDRWGVRAKIKTLDFQGPLPPWPAGYKHAAAYVNLFLNDYNYQHRWIQVGYAKRCQWYFFFPIWETYFYCETQAVEWYDIVYWETPTFNVFYRYSIYYVYGNTWEITIHTEAGTLLHSIRRTVSNSQPDGMYVGIETTAPDIVITGSHFKALKYYDISTLSWKLWSLHFAELGTNPNGLTNPYYLNQISHYEFTALGP